jgi:hypothetical protein
LQKLRAAGISKPMCDLGGIAMKLIPQALPFRDRGLANPVLGLLPTGT